MHAVLLLLFLIIFPISIFAQDITPQDLLPTGELDLNSVTENSEYKLEIKPVRPQKGTNDDKKNIETLSNADRATFTSQGYLVKPLLFINTKDKQPESYEGGITFTLTNSRLNFGNISGKILKTAEIGIKTSAESPYGYVIIGQQQTPFISKAEDQIAPTICDQNRSICSATIANIWNNDDSYGWGYSINGKGVPQDFKSLEYYRPLVLSTDTLFAKISPIVGINNNLLRFKINTPPNTPEGTYSTLIRLFLFPTD